MALTGTRINGSVLYAQFQWLQRHRHVHHQHPYLEHPCQVRCSSQSKVQTCHVDLLPSRVCQDNPLHKEMRVLLQEAMLIMNNQIHPTTTLARHFSMYQLYLQEQAQHCHRDFQITLFDKETPVLLPCILNKSFRKLL